MDATASQTPLALPIRRVGTEKCAGQHFGPWSVAAGWFRSAAEAVRAGTMKPRAIGAEGADVTPVSMTQGPVAVITIDGMMTKGGSSFGGCSTVDVRQAVRAAAADPRVGGIMLIVSSPGGTCAGTPELADDVAAAAALKPLWAYIEDMGCSAAYWVASQAEQVYANRTATVGSIGTMVVLEDDTAMQEKVGIKFTVVSTGPYKGLGADGSVPDKLVAEYQDIVDQLNTHFLAAVTSGRGFTAPQMQAVADGRVWIGAQAQAAGLIDQVATLDDAMAALTLEIQTMTTDEFNAHAAANPTAVQRFIDQGNTAGHAAGLALGRTEGAAAERARFDELAEMAAEHPAFAIEQYKAGATVSAAAKAYAGHLRVQAQQAKTLDASNGVPPLNVPGPAAVGGNVADPEQAWASNKDGCQQNFNTKAHYLAFAKHQARVVAAASTN